MRQFDRYPIEGQALYHRTPGGKGTSVYASMALPAGPNRYIVVQVQADNIQPTSVPKAGEGFVVVTGNGPEFQAIPLGEILLRGSHIEWHLFDGHWQEAPSMQEAIDTITLHEAAQRVQLGGRALREV